MKYLRLVSVLSLVFLTMACSKGDLEDLGSGTATLEVTASIVPPGEAKSSGIGNKFTGDLNFDSGYIWLSQVDFDGTLDRGASINRRVRRFSKIDLATGEAIPRINDISIPTGKYNFLNLEVELRNEDSQPAIRLEGTYVRSDGSSCPIRFEFNSGERFEAETDQFASVDEKTTILSIIRINPLIWFGNVPVGMLDNANLLPNGILHISKDFNEDIYALVEDGLDESAESEFSN